MDYQPLTLDQHLSALKQHFYHQHFIDSTKKYNDWQALLLLSLENEAPAGFVPLSIAEDYYYNGVEFYVATLPADELIKYTEEAIEEDNLTPISSEQIINTNYTEESFSLEPTEIVSEYFKDELDAMIDDEALEYELGVYDEIEPKYDEVSNHALLDIIEHELNNIDASRQGNHIEDNTTRIRSILVELYKRI